MNVDALVGFIVSTGSAHADEIWVAPTHQQDFGGLGIGSNSVWPGTPFGAVRLVLAIPSDLESFESAKLVLIPHAPGGAAHLAVHVCAAEHSDLVAADCAGPFAKPFTGVANRLQEVDISLLLPPQMGAAGLNYLAVVAYTTPTTSTDHIVGLRFSYERAAVATGAIADGAVTAPKVAPGAAHHARYTDAEAIAAAGIRSLDDLEGLTCEVGGNSGTTEISVAPSGAISFNCVVPPPPPTCCETLTPDAPTASAALQFMTRAQSIPTPALESGNCDGFVGSGVCINPSSTSVSASPTLVQLSGTAMPFPFDAAINISTLNPLFVEYQLGGIPVTCQLTLSGSLTLAGQVFSRASPPGGRSTAQAPGCQASRGRRSADAQVCPQGWRANCRM